MNKDKPGIGSTTFTIPLDENWYCNQEIISPKDWKVSESSGVIYMSVEEIIEKYSECLTDEELELLNNK